MKKKRERNWTQMLQSHSVTCDQVKRGLEQLDQILDSEEDPTAAIHELKETVAEMQQEAHELHDTMVLEPSRCLLSRDRLNITEQQYLMSFAAGFNCFTPDSLGVSPITLCEAYRLCVYEDDKVVGFWHPDQTPPRPPSRKGNIKTIHIQLIRSPEEIDPDYLREEQNEFIDKFRPDVRPRLGLLKRNGRK